MKKMFKGMGLLMWVAVVAAAALIAFVILPAAGMSWQEILDIEERTVRPDANPPSTREKAKAWIGRTFGKIFGRKSPSEAGRVS